MNFLINLGYGANATFFNLILKFAEPDLVIGCAKSAGGSASYREIYERTNHELSHASHFSQVGSAYWAKYVSYIMTYGAYGDGTGNNAQLCGIGEMWGFAMGRIQEYEKYEPTTWFNNSYPYVSHSGWIKPHAFWDLVRKNVLTKKEIYDCLSSDVDTYYKLIAKMYALYPDKADAIETAFVSNGINPGVPKPPPPPPPPTDTNFDNQAVVSDTIVAGNIIFTQNVTVSNNAKLTFNPGSSITVNPPFTVNSGSKLEILF